MKLETYFNQIAEERISDEKKISLYQRICEERGKEQHSLGRVSIFKRTRVYAILSIVVICATFGIFFQDIPELLEYRAFWVEKTPTGGNIARANSVAEILEINGEYIIEKEGKTFQNSVLFDGDVISLKDNAKIIFNINDNIKAEIQGPAKFSISKINDEKYHLFLMEGDFLKIDGNEHNDALQVETQEMVIETEKDEAIALELTKTDKKTELRNKGAKLLVKNKVDKEDEEKVLETEKLLTMEENDIMSISDIQGFASALSTRKNITYTTSSQKNTKNDESGNVGATDLSEEEWEKLVSDGSFLASNTQEITDGIENDVSSALSYQADERLVPTENQLSQVTAALNSTFLLGDLKDLYIAKQLNDNEKIVTAYRNILRRLKSVGDNCGVTVSLDASPNNISNQIDSIKEGLSHYYFPPNKEHQLSVLKNWINYIDSNSLSEDWDTFQSNLPVSLRF